MGVQVFNLRLRGSLRMFFLLLVLFFESGVRGFVTGIDGRPPHTRDGGLIIFSPSKQILHASAGS